jgi:hypothetical protein
MTRAKIKTEIRAIRKIRAKLLSISEKEEDILSKNK